MVVHASCAIGCVHLALGCVQHVKTLYSVTLNLQVPVPYIFFTFNILSLSMFGHFRRFVHVSLDSGYQWTKTKRVQTKYRVSYRKALKLVMSLTLLPPTRRSCVRPESESCRNSARTSLYTEDIRLTINWVTKPGLPTRALQLRSTDARSTVQPEL